MEVANSGWKPYVAWKGGCPDAPATCPKVIWEQCKMCAWCFTDESCGVAGCTSDDTHKPAMLCDGCGPCKDLCFTPSEEKCTDCGNACSAYLESDDGKAEDPGIVWDSTFVEKKYGVPVPDPITGKYDMPWGRPLNPNHDDLACKLPASGWNEDFLPKYKGSGHDSLSGSSREESNTGTQGSANSGKDLEEPDDVDAAVRQVTSMAILMVLCLSQITA